jgi:hypothetical protein
MAFRIRCVDDDDDEALVCVLLPLGAKVRDTTTSVTRSVKASRVISIDRGMVRILLLIVVVCISS